MTEVSQTEEAIKIEPEGDESKTLAEASRMTTSRRIGRRGRKPVKVDVKVKLERSRQSARECRARKKLRYQYLEELVASREKAIYSLRRELDNYKKHTKEMEAGIIPPDVRQMVTRYQQRENNCMDFDDYDDEDDDAVPGQS